MKIFDALLDLLFPPRCPFCRKIGKGGVCSSCEAKLPYTEKPLREGAPFGKCAAPLYYEGAVREAILRFKFEGVSSMARDFAPILARCVSEELAGEFDVVTWAPVSEKRLRSRGYDQAYLLARETARLWDTKPVRLLRKCGDNPAQSSLKDAAARRANVLGMYDAVDDAPLDGARVLLIDDILTTGSTLGECARVLKDAGAASVVCAALAMTRGEKK